MVHCVVQIYKYDELTEYCHRPTHGARMQRVCLRASYAVIGRYCFPIVCVSVCLSVQKKLKTYQPEIDVIWWK